VQANVANIAHGVHSGSSKTSDEKIIAKIRRVVNLHQDLPRMALGVQFNLPAIASNTEPPFRYTPKHIDVALVEIFAAAHFLTASPAIIELESLIVEELNSLS
jgi:hypothetical protein